MKVMHISVNFIGSSLYKKLFKKLYELGIEQIVITPIQENINEESDSISEYDVIYLKVLNIFCRIFYFYKIKKIYSSIIREKLLSDIRFIHAHTLFSDGGVAYLLNKKLKIPYVVAVRNTDINAFLKYKKYLKYFGSKIIKEAKQIIFISPSYRKTFIEIMPKGLKDEILKKSIILPNGIDNYWVKHTAPEMKKIEKRIKLMFMGTIDKNKNLLFNLKVCSELNKKGLLTTLDVVGEGNELENCKKSVRQLGISDKVIFHGKIKDQEKIRDIMSNCNIFLLNSKYETFGLVYAEALSQGLWLLYTKDQGFDNQFKDGEVGYSIEYNNVEQCISSIMKIKNHDNNHNRNIKDLINKFDWNRIALVYSRIYDEEYRNASSK